MKIEQQLQHIPAKPGIYIFKNGSGEFLYVGKAKILRSRVRSYFRTNAGLEPAKEKMVPQIASIETIVCDSEHEALILEANLISRHKPPYNVILTDDKFYLFIKITKEDLPRVFPVRRLSRDGARYFGPYSSAHSVRQTLKLLQRLFPHRTDKDNTNDWIFPHPLFSNGQKTSRQIIDESKYHENINNIIRFLKGDRIEIEKTLREGMMTAATHHEYERASIYRDQLKAAEKLEGDQKVLLPRPESFDVISIVTDKNRSAANLFLIRRGKLLSKNTFLLKHREATSREEVLRQFILQYYRDAQDVPPVVLIPWPLADESTLTEFLEKPISFLVPERGKKRQLVSMGELNAQQLLSMEHAVFEQSHRLEAATLDLARALRAGDRPLHRIETYDISNIQGSFATGSLVVFIDGKPSRGDYRKFRIKQEDGPNDYAMLAEVLSRRFRGTHKDWATPDLVIVDGGKGQLSSAQKTFDKLGVVNVPLASLAKQREELFIPGQPEPIRLPYDSDALYLVQRMRDEAHRFTITYHRLLRSKQSSRSILDDIPGIGPHTKKKLLRHFGSLKSIRAATEDEIKAVIGNKAKILKEYI